MRENRLHRACARILDRRGAYRLTQTAPPAPVGTPDEIACYRGYFLALELKTRGQSPTPAQAAALRRAAQAGAIATVVRSPRQLCDLLDRIDRIADHHIDRVADRRPAYRTTATTDQETRQ